MAEGHAALRFTRRYWASLDEVWRALTEQESVALYFDFWTPRLDRFGEAVGGELR